MDKLKLVVSNPDTDVLGNFSQYKLKLFQEDRDQETSSKTTRQKTKGKDNKPYKQQLFKLRRTFQ